MWLVTIRLEEDTRNFYLNIHVIDQYYALHVVTNVLTVESTYLLRQSFFTPKWSSQKLKTFSPWNNGKLAFTWLFLSGLILFFTCRNDTSLLVKIWRVDAMGHPKKKLHHFLRKESRKHLRKLKSVGLLDNLSHQPIKFQPYRSRFREKSERDRENPGFRHFFSFIY